MSEAASGQWRTCARRPTTPQTPGTSSSHPPPPRARAAGCNNVASFSPAESRGSRFGDLSLGWIALPGPSLADGRLRSCCGPRCSTSSPLSEPGPHRVRHRALAPVGGGGAALWMRPRRVPLEVELGPSPSHVTVARPLYNESFSTSSSGKKRAAPQRDARLRSASNCGLGLTTSPALGHFLRSRIAPASEVGDE